jgi:hypothetical protein
MRLRKKKPFSMAHVGRILSPETLLAGHSQRLLATANFFRFQRNLGSGDGADWFANWNCCDEPVLFVTAAQEFLLGQKLVSRVKLPTEQDEMLFPRVQVQDVDLLPASGRCADLEKLTCFVTTNVDDNLRRLFRGSLPIPAHAKRQRCGFYHLNSCTHPGREPI